MKKWIAIITVIGIAQLVLQGSVSSAATDSTKVQVNLAVTKDYTATEKYDGEYSANTLYFRKTGAKRWFSFMPNKKYNEFVKCKDALTELGKKGIWLGHIKSDGDCGSKDEPIEFSTGNFLNFLFSGGANDKKLKSFPHEQI